MTVGHRYVTLRRARRALPLCEDGDGCHSRQKRRRGACDRIGWLLAILVELITDDSADDEDQEQLADGFPIGGKF
jgi:hypothetical protein